MNLEKALEACAAALKRGETDAAAGELLAAWRESPYPELAAALGRFPSRPLELDEETPTAEMKGWLRAWGRAGPLDVPALLARLTLMAKSRLPRFTKPCFDALAAALADPRIGTFVFGRVGSPLPAPRQLLSLLWRHASPANIPLLEALTKAAGGGRYKPVLNTMKRKAAAMKPLEADVRGRIVSLGMEAAKASLPKVAEVGETTLLAAVRGAPGDASAREVFRDWLLERGDPWGELIALQEHRARNADAKVTPRERTLLREQRPRILGSLAGVKKSVLDELVFERGFPVSGTVKVKGVTRVAALLSCPELSTFERVVFMRDAALTPNLKVLREAHGLKAESLAAALKKAPDVQLEVLTAEGEPEQLRDVDGLQALRELYLVARLQPRHVLRAAAKLPVMKQLRAFGMVHVWAPDAFVDWSWEAIDSLPESVQTVVLETTGGMKGRFVFVRAKDGWDAKVEAPTSMFAQEPVLGSSPYDANAVRQAKLALKESRSVQFSDSLDADVRAALEPG